MHIRGFAPLIVIVAVPAALGQVYENLFVTEIGGSTQSIPYCAN